MAVEIIKKLREKCYKVNCNNCGAILKATEKDEIVKKSCEECDTTTYYIINCPNCGQSICVYIKYPYGCMNYRKDF